MKIRKTEKLLLILVFLAVFIVWKSSTLVLIEENSKQRTKILGGSSKKNNSSRNRQREQLQKSSSPSYFVLHIGPPKTATTTIQCGLHHLSEQLATDDSYYYIGKSCPQLNGRPLGNNESAIAGHHLLMGLNDANPNTRGYVHLKERLVFHKLRGDHIVYSNEGFANHLEDKNASWECLQKLLQGWNVRIVIGYRHYFQWIRSLYYQQYLHAKKYKLNWPGQNGKGRPHPPFLEYLDYHLKRWETGDVSVDGGHSARAFGHHLSLSTYKKFKLYFDDVRFYNLYQDGDLVTNFVCGMLPNADKTCASMKLEQDEEGPVASVKAKGLLHRVSKSFDAHRISEAAYEKGIVKNSSPKDKFVDLVERKIQATKLDSNPTYLDCPSTSLEDRFFNASVSFEKEMLLVQNPSLPEKELEKIRYVHQNMFQMSKAEKAFCEINPDLVLKDQHWVDFLAETAATTAQKN
jgi:hypothetical protein